MRICFSARSSKARTTGRCARQPRSPTYERDFGRVETKSALVGAICQVRDDVAVDIGLHGAWITDHPAGEIRAGITFAFAVR